MKSENLTITYVGGPTVLLEFGGVQLLTDPTFDPAGGEYTMGPVTLRKISGPAIRPEELSPFDYVLLTHDHHADNLDRKGREVLANAKKVITTNEGAGRLGGNALGLSDWQSFDISGAGGRILRIVATPARHGPEGLHRGPVIGFVVFLADSPDHAIYISGDTVWYDGVAEIARRYNIRVLILHLGAARVPVVGPYHLTMTAAEGVEAARAFANAAIVPVHFEDWAHFSEGRNDVSREFASAGLEGRLRWPKRGGEIQIEL